jgi:hypothetical protein
MSDEARPLPDDELVEGETTLSEITITPDGRVFTFGTSRAIVEILHELRPDDPKVGEILKRLHAPDADPPPT